MFAQARVFLLALLLIWSLSHASVFGDTGDQPAPEPTPAQKIRDILDRSMHLDYSGNLGEVLEALKERTKISFVLDVSAWNPPLRALEEIYPKLQLKSSSQGKVRVALQRMLSVYNLTFVILDDSVLITSEEAAIVRQMRQHASVQVADVPVSSALKNLAKSYAVNLVIDPRLGTDADTKVTLRLDDAALETSIRLLAELGNLKSIRVGNVLFITTEARADKMRREDTATGSPGG